MLVSEKLSQIALEKELRRSTFLSYERLLRSLSLLDEEVSEVSQAAVTERLWQLSNPNTRRATIIALRSVFGWKMKIPRSIPRRYDLPSEDELRFALMFSPKEARGLLMMYAGLRIGEACAITHKDRHGDRLTVDKQVLELHRTGSATTWSIGPTKTAAASIVIPELLFPVVDSINEIDKPGRVRESLRRAGTKAGFSLTPHMLRKWYCSHLISHGLPLELVRKQMRHSDISITLGHYQQFSEADIHKLFG